MTAAARQLAAVARHAPAAAPHIDETKLWRAQIERLRMERDEALERICQLEDLLVARDTAHFCDFGLTHSENMVFGALLRWPVISKDQLMDLLYGCRTDPPGPDNISILIMRVRRKLKPHGVVIRTLWGRGYSMDEMSRARLNGQGDGRRHYDRC